MIDRPVDLQTPALLFPAVSLLMLAYTNRYIAVSNLIRSLHDRHCREPSDVITRQIASLRLRVRIIRSMQAASVASMLASVISMLLMFLGRQAEATWLFGAALTLMTLSLFLSMREIGLSVRALDILLEDMGEWKSPRKR
ncbi:MAG: DUF2721 domain-containing protein [Silvanigrellales bacterium]|jgi:hypothetical protein|nr:DUF2721 domain-containing protein [Silvanigrellales bacterium]